MKDFNPISQASHISKIVRELQSPKAFAAAQKNPVQFFAEHGINLPANIQYEIHRDDEKLINFVLPFDTTKEMSEEQLQGVIAAQIHFKTSTASTLGSAGTLGSISSELCIGTVMGSAGSATTFSTAACLATASSLGTLKK